MKHLIVLSFVILAIQSAFASHFVPIQMNDLTLFIKRNVEFRAIKQSPNQYTLTWSASNISPSIHYRIERFSVDTGAPITTETLPTHWINIGNTTTNSFEVTHSFDAFDLNGSQRYRLLECDAYQCFALAELSYQLNRDEMDSLALKNLAVAISPIYIERFETRSSAQRPTLKSSQTTANPYREGYGFSMLSQHSNPNGHNIGANASSSFLQQVMAKVFRSSNQKIISNQAILTWDLVQNADHYIVVKTDIRADYPTKSIVRDVTAEYKAITNTFVYELVGGEYQFEVFACKNDPNDNLPPICGKRAIHTSQSVVSVYESQQPQNLQLIEDTYASDGKVSENQSFSLTWDRPNQVILGDWDLVRYDVYGELNGKLTHNGEEILYSNNTLTLTRNLGTKFAPYLTPGRQYCYKVIPIYRNRYTGEEDVGQFANPSPHKCMTVGNKGFIPAPDTFNVFRQPPDFLAGQAGYYLNWSQVPDAAYYQIDRYIDGIGWTPIYTGEETYTLEYFADDYYAIGLRLSACSQDNRCGNYRRLYFNTDNIQFNFKMDHTKLVRCLYLPTLQTDSNEMLLQWCDNHHPDLKNYVIKKQGNDTPIIDQPAINYRTNVNGLRYFDVIDSIGDNEHDVCFKIETTYHNDPIVYHSEYQCTQMRLSTTVSSIAVINKFTGHIQLNWTEVNGATHYNIQQAICQSDCSTLTESSWQDLTMVHVNTSLELEGKNTNTYAYRIAACKSTQCSSYSNTVEFTPSHSQIIFIHTDHLGSPAVESTINGEIGSTRMHYKAFGDSIGQPKNDVGYTGHKFDTDLGLSYMQARYYDPVIGRFYSNDPVGSLIHFTKGNLHGFNRYTYANNSPYKYIDPDGREADIFENRKRHEQAVKIQSQKLEKQGWKVRNEVRMNVDMGGGETAVRIMDIVAQKGDRTRLIEIKTMKDKEKKGAASIARKLNPLSRTVEASKLTIRGTFQIFQMEKDLQIGAIGATEQRTGAQIGPTTVEWQVMTHNKKQFLRTLPPIKIQE